MPYKKSPAQQSKFGRMDKKTPMKYTPVPGKTTTVNTDIQQSAFYPQSLNNRGGRLNIGDYHPPGVYPAARKPKNRF